MCDFDAKRRKFLAEALTGLGIMMMPFPRMLFAAETGKKGKRQHLINILDNGGWDSHYTLNYLDPALINEMSNAPAGYADLNKLRYGSVSTANTHAVMHPTGALLAPGLKNWTAGDFNKTLIVRGLPVIAGHGQHQFIYGGGTSPYMASYSALVAASQASTRGASPLHYVKLSGGTRDVIHSGMLTGLGIPSLMPNHPSWQTLTTPRGTQMGAAATDSKILEQGLEQLGNAAAKKVKREASKGVVNGYLNGYSASVLLSNSNYASSDGFLSTWVRYFNALKAEASSQASSGLGNFSGFKADQSGQGLTETSGFATHFSTLASASMSNSTIVDTSSTTVIEFARNTAWKFALTEFLILNDLSSVVDLIPTGNDSHRSLIYPGVQNTLAFAAIRELMNKLAATRNPDGSGSLLDCTLITYGSEFDRMGTYVTDVGNWGTGHGVTFSMMMAGHRCNSGKVFGNVTQGEKATGIFKSGYGQPIKFHPDTGEIGTGPGVSAYSIFPTVMAIMGVDIPAQQITEYKPIPILIKA